MQINIENESIRLLDWLYSQEDTTLLYDVSEYVKNEGFPEDSARLLVEHLRHQGLVTAAIAISGHADAMITSQGITHMQRIHSHREDPAAQARALQSAMLRWLFERERAAEITMEWSGLLSSDRAYLLGDLSLDDVEHEAEYLSDKGLITGRDVEERPRGALWPKLTHAGRDCVMDFKGNVADYNTRGHRGSMTNHFNVTGNTGNFMIASNNSQQNVTTGIDTDTLIKFATAVRDSTSILQLPTGDDESELYAQARELDELANSSNPSKGRMKQLVDALMTGLTKAASPIATSIATTLGNDALRALGH